MHSTIVDPRVRVQAKANAQHEVESKLRGRPIAETLRCRIKPGDCTE